MSNNRADGFGEVAPAPECGPNGRKPNEDFHMRNTTFISSVVLSVACVSAANADYVLQTFSGSGSVSAGANRANQSGDFNQTALNYNAIAGGASTMTVEASASAYGSTNSAALTNAVNKGTYSNGSTVGSGPSTQYYKTYYGGYTTSSPFTADDNYRTWSVSANAAANVQSSVMNFSSGAQYDTGIATSTKVRYTSSAYSTVQSVQVGYKSDAIGAVGAQTQSTLAYAAGALQVMDLSASTGFTGIRIEGSGIGWATEGYVEFYVSDNAGASSLVSIAVTGNGAMGNYLASVLDLQASAGGVLDFSQITSMSIAFRGVSAVDGPLSPTSSSQVGLTGNNDGFSYNASQVTLVGYAVPAPGAVALLGAAGLIGARRRRA